MTEKKMTVTLEARIAGLQRQMDAAAASVERFKDRFDRSNKSVVSGFDGILGGASKLAAGVGLSLATTALAVKNTVSSMAELNDTADMLGITAESLQKLDYTAKLSGSSVEDMRSGFQKFSATLGEAQAGSSKAADLFKSLGIPLKDAAGQARDAEEVMYDFADAVSSVEDKQARLALVQEVFGKGAGSLVNVLSKGREGMKGLADEADRVGAVVGDDLVAKAAEFDERWKKVMAAATGHFKSFALVVLSTLDSFGQGFDKIVITPQSKRSEAINQRFLHDKSPQGQLESVERQIYGAQPRSDSVENLQKKREQLSQQVIREREWLSALDHAKKQTEALDKELAEKNKKKIAESTEENLKKILGNNTSGSGSAASNAKATASAYAEVVAQLKAENEALTAGIGKQDAMNALRRAGVDASSAQGKAILDMVEKNNQLEQSLKAQEQAVERNRDAFRDLGLSFTSAFEDAVVAGSKFSDVLKGLFDDITRIAIRRSVTEPLGDLVSGFADKFAGSFDFSSLWPFANGGIMSSGGSVPLRAYSSGGVAYSPQLALFGEGSKPEAYVPLPDGRSIPVSMRGGIGGTAVKLTVINNTPATVQQHSDSAGNLTLMIDQAVSGLIADGGSRTRRALRAANNESAIRRG